MPLRSLAQLRYMEMRAHTPPRKARRGKEMSPDAARKFIADAKAAGQNFKRLPERVKPKGG